MIECTVINSFAEQAFYVLLVAYNCVSGSDFTDENTITVTQQQVIFNIYFHRALAFVSIA
eukprot:m.421325 g.421325  ORF g.421325 m.421325 type:complete len:60 (-) comp33796_c0_seq1:129-308(-)